MNKQDLITIAGEYIEASEENYISQEMAIFEKLVGMKIFEAPIFAFGNPNDDYFLTLKEPSVIGRHHLYPKEWLPRTKTVISFFLPFSEEVIKGNRKGDKWPSSEWLHGRIEGQLFLNKLARYLTEVVQERTGCENIIPSLDQRFMVQMENKKDTLYTDKSFSSNWSERHVAFICGLGTFGLSKGLITSKGMAGRLGSIVTEHYFPYDHREYKDIYEYCSRCGACIKKCPVQAISIENGKNHLLCSRFLDNVLEKYSPRYACGKCQVGVPCEHKIPK